MNSDQYWRQLNQARGHAIGYLDLPKPLAAELIPSHMKRAIDEFNKQVERLAGAGLDAWIRKPTDDWTSPDAAGPTGL